MLWVQSMSDYDQVMFEDETKNRLRDSLEAWKDTINKETFDKSAIIVFLNKMDLLQKKFIDNQIPINSENLLPGCPEAPVCSFVCLCVLLGRW